MMRETRFGTGSMGRIWLGELPQFCYVPERGLRREIEGRVGSLLPFMIAAEVLVARGGRMVYGAVGAEYSPASSGESQSLVVEIGIMEGGTRLLDSLAAAADDVRIGLTSEYAIAVLHGIEEVQRGGNPLPPGKLKINCASHAFASSNVPIFQRLGSWVSETRGHAELVFDELRMQQLLSN